MGEELGNETHIGLLLVSSELLSPPHFTLIVNDDSC